MPINSQRPKSWILGCFFVVFLSSANAQSDSTLQLSVNSYALVSTSDAVPFWLVSNKYGIYEGDQNEFIVQADLAKQFYFGQKFKAELGINGIAKSNIEHSYLHEIYGNLSYGKLRLIVGKEEITFTQYSCNTSTGSYFFSNNARPVPRIGIGFYEFTDVPFTHGYLQIKGFINQGMLMDDRGPEGTDQPLLHEKLAYLRTNHLPVNVHVGLNHSALYGGTLPNGAKLPVDYWATFFGKGSDKIGGGEATNAAGAHSGLFDVGINTKINNAFLQFYLQKPFTDRSGFTRFFENNKDHIFGIVFQSRNKNSLIKEITYENISLLWQSGEGLFDLIINGKGYYGDDLNDKDKIMWEEYGIKTDNISDDDFWRFVTRKENYGFKYGGRDNYYNNGLYKRGWSNWGKALGNPLLLTEKRVKSINPDFDSSYDYYFVSTRVFAHHFGLMGQYKNLQFRTMFTYTKNYGSYRGLNKGNNNWDSKDPYSDYRYYFEGGLHEVYTYFEFDYTLPKLPQLGLNLQIGADSGQMYDSFGAILGVRYHPQFTKSKSQN